MASDETVGSCNKYFFCHKLLTIIIYLIAKKPSKHPYLNIVVISLKPARLSISRFPFDEKGYKTPLSDFPLEIISLAE